MLGPVRYPKRFLRGHALVALVCAHKRVHVQGNVDPGADCSVSLIGLEEDDLVSSIDDGETSSTAVIPRGGYSCAGDENLRERVPDGQRRRELPLERRVGADVVSRLNTPSRFRNSKFFKVSKPRRQYAQGCIEERIPVAPCQQRCRAHSRVLQCGHQR